MDSHTAQEKRCPKPQAILTEDKAIEIFKVSLQRSAIEKPNASLVAREYGVNEKTIRDIWTGRTWRDETQPLAIGREPRPREKTGRPLGSKDSVPRRRKVMCDKPQVLGSHLNEIKEVASEAFCSQPYDQISASVIANLYAEGDKDPILYDPPLPEPKRRRLLPELMDQWQPSLSLPMFPAASMFSSNQCPLDTTKPWARNVPSSYIATTRRLPPSAILHPLLSAGCADAAPGAPSVVQSRMARVVGATSLVPPPPLAAACQPLAAACQPLAQPPSLFGLPAQPSAPTRGAFHCAAPPAAARRCRRCCSG